ncbi:MAG: hypothetical protein HOE90_10935 [Bacteriovoracaceae bacterium]|jgi:hypothetical protein|nr:hypothetical protein [Bacteriovoracaceae bacterium]
MKRITKFILLISSITILPSCSVFIENIFVEKNEYQLKEIKSTKYCPKESKHGAHRFYSSSEKVNRLFSDFLENNKNLNLYFSEKMVLWGLIQVNAQPFLSSPASRLQAIVYYGGKFKFWDFKKPEKSSYSYIKALDDILHDYPSKRSLKSLAGLLDKKFQSTITVSKELAVLLSKKRNLLLKNPILKKTYFRDNELLRVNEPLFKVSFSQLIAKYQKKSTPWIKKNHTHQVLFPIELENIDDNFDLAECNFDPGLYKNKVFILDKEQIFVTSFGMVDHKQNSFLAISGQNLASVEEIDNFKMIRGRWPKRLGSWCILQNQKPKLSVVLTSFNSRDSGQLLMGPLEKIERLKLDQSKISTLIEAGREIFFLSPPRIYIESRILKNQHIEKNLKSQLPVYHADKIGNIHSLLRSEDKKMSLIIDSRFNGNLLCK